MFDGWKRAAVLALVVIALAIYSIVRPVPERSDVDRLEARLSTSSVEGFSASPLPTQTYVRYYAFVRAGREDDLPFTRIAEGVTLPRDRRLIAGVLVLPRLAGQEGPGVRRVARRDMPATGERGCGEVHLLYDPRGEALLGAWCSPPPAARPESPRR